MSRHQCLVFGLILVAVILMLCLINLDRVPAPWWDEGWTMNVARNWVERGWYGQLLNGEPAPPGLTAAFPTVASVALSFKLLGVGIWQGRLALVFYVFTALILLYALGVRLYDRRVGAAAVIVTLIASADPSIHPIFLGRQVLAELPMLVFLLFGYLSLWWALQRSRWWLVVACGAWGLALITKAQTLPFWAISLLLPAVLVAIKRRWQLFAVLAVALIGSYVASRLWSVAIDLLLQGHTLPTPQPEGLTDVTAVVLIPQVRVALLILVMQIGLPTLLGLSYIAWRWLRRVEPLETHQQWLRLSAWSLAASWLGWYILLSRGSPRYAFPAIFVGSIFVAALLGDLTAHFDFAATLARVNRMFKTRQFDRRTVSAMLFLTLLLAMIVLNLQWAAAYVAQAVSSEAPLADVVTYLNSRTPSGALIETYDSELFVLLDRPYHFPPDQTHIALIRDVTRRNFGIDEEASAADRELLNYDPLAAAPDYLVVGPAHEVWRRLYEPVLTSGAVRLVYATTHYQVYARAP